MPKISQVIFHTPKQAKQEFIKQFSILKFKNTILTQRAILFNFQTILSHQLQYYESTGSMVRNPAVNFAQKS